MLDAVKGRGAVNNRPHRFSSVEREAFNDGWGLSECESQSFRTEVLFEVAISAITKNESPDIHFDRAVNPYRGCEHGCIYCYARPTHSYLNYSPGLDFETKIIAKTNISSLLREELGNKSYQPRLLNIGSATDCYQPVERELKLTRSILEVLSECNHPFSLVTKSSGIERDIDLIAEMASRNLAAIYITITTLASEVSRKMEPRASAPARRLRTIERLAKAGIPVGVSLAPHIPFITDDMEKVLSAARDAGAKSAFYQIVRLPWEVSSLFRDWLDVNFPERAARVMARIQEMRNGKDYDANFATRMKGDGLWADLVKRRFETSTSKLGFNRGRIELDVGQFVRPGCSRQISLF